MERKRRARRGGRVRWEDGVRRNGGGGRKEEEEGKEEGGRASAHPGSTEEPAAPEGLLSLLFSKHRESKIWLSPSINFYTPKDLLGPLPLCPKGSLTWWS